MNEVPEVSLEEAKQKLGTPETTFVDIRHSGDYVQAHVPGALHLDETSAAQWTQTADKAKPIIVYCYHGYSSQDAAAWLLESGFQNVHSMRGGFEGWRSAFPSDIQK